MFTTFSHAESRRQGGGADVWSISWRNMIEWLRTVADDRSIRGKLGGGADYWSISGRLGGG